MYSKLQYISQGETLALHQYNIQEALDAGCNWVQLRVKGKIGIVELTNFAEKIKIQCQQYNATFIINDSVEIAKNVNADGIHLGLSDTPVAQARSVLGADKIIGGTANTLVDVKQRINEHCDYIGLGPLRFTNTKEQLSPILDFEGFQEIFDNLSDTEKKTPIYAIGGLTEADIKPLQKMGIYGVAVSGIITHSSNKKMIIQQFTEVLA
ncbi:MAG: thiamine phosphate synthase [Pseudarcicella sp.]|nr:thiamine phosphate synthase [Pseudarcicella sp.]MBP6411032.1 thiamine phosphate synthase [Pseudarcicella sp.]